MLALLAATATHPVDTTRYQIAVTQTNAIMPEDDVQFQEQTLESNGWLRMEVPSGAGTVRAVIDSGRWTTRGFAMLHEVSTDALRGMVLQASVRGDGAPTSAVTGAGEHPIASSFQDVLGFVRGAAPAASRTDSLVAETDGGHWRVTRTITWARVGDTWQGTIVGAIAQRDPGTSSGSEAGTVALHFGADGAMDRATVELRRDLSIESEHGNVTVRQAVQGTLSRVP